MSKTLYVIARNSFAAAVAYALLVFNQWLGVPHDVSMILSATFCAGYIADNSVSRARVSRPQEEQEPR